MYEDMNDVETILYIEMRFGCLSKSMPEGWSPSKVEVIDTELKNLLHKYRNELNIRTPVPRIRSWVEGSKVYFLFFDKLTGKRIMLGNWLIGKDGYYEH